MSTLDIILPDEDKSIIPSKYHKSSTSILPDTINIHRKKSVFFQSAGLSGQHVQSVVLSEESNQSTVSMGYSNQSSDPSQGRSKMSGTELGEYKLFEDTQLYEAVIMNDTVFVEYLLNNGHITHVRSLEGWTYLHLAVMHTADDVILQQLINNLDMSVHDIDGNTALDLLLIRSWNSKKIEVLQNAILRLVAHGEVAELKRLVMNGWYFWPSFNEISSKCTILKTLKLFLKNIKYAQVI